MLSLCVSLVLRCSDWTSRLFRSQQGRRCLVCGFPILPLGLPSGPPGRCTFTNPAACWAFGEGIELARALERAADLEAEPHPGCRENLWPCLLTVLLGTVTNICTVFSKVLCGSPEMHFKIRIKGSV